VGARRSCRRAPGGFGEGRRPIADRVRLHPASASRRDADAKAFMFNVGRPSPADAMMGSSIPFRAAPSPRSPMDADRFDGLSRLPAVASGDGPVGSRPRPCRRRIGRCRCRPPETALPALVFDLPALREGPVPSGRNPRRSALRGRPVPGRRLRPRSRVVPERQTDTVRHRPLPTVLHRRPVRSVQRKGLPLGRGRGLRVPIRERVYRRHLLVVLPRRRLRAVRQGPGRRLLLQRGPPRRVPGQSVCAPGCLQLDEVVLRGAAPANGPVAALRETGLVNDGVRSRAVYANGRRSR
jgi:hypothetical protein